MGSSIVGIEQDLPLTIIRAILSCHIGAAYTRNTHSIAAFNCLTFRSAAIVGVFGMGAEGVGEDRGEDSDDEEDLHFGDGV